MSAGNLLFIVSALSCLVGALVTVAAKNPIRGAVGLLTTIIGIAGLFLKLDAQFLAAIQLIVYAGAVVVLFVFVIMLLGPDAGLGRSRPLKATVSRWLGAAVMLLLSGLVLRLAVGGTTKLVRFGPAQPEYGSVEAVGGLLFGPGIVPFELATALLIVAVVGAIAVARSRHEVHKKSDDPNPTRRLFHGPLDPRDAGRPLHSSPQHSTPQHSTRQHEESA